MNSIPATNFNSDSVSSRKQQTRSYTTVELSHRTLDQKKPFKCWECGTRITTLRNEPLLIVEVEMMPEDIGGRKSIEGFCRPCNRVFLFV